MLGGVLLTLPVTVWLDHRKGRRETTARLVEHTRESVYRWTERKLDLYSRHLKSCHDLRDLDVWPGSSSQPLTATGSLTDAIARSATEIVFIAPARVSGPAQRAVTGPHRARHAGEHCGVGDRCLLDRYGTLRGGQRLPCTGP